MKKLLAMLLAVTMLMGIASVVMAESTDMPLVVAIDTLSSKFSPFYCDTDYDQQVVNLTQVLISSTDRVGAIVYNGIEGETRTYNGTEYTYYGASDLTVDYDESADITTYTIKLREDMVFSDGEPVTADDVIFNYYVYLDPSYQGSVTLRSYDIIGLKSYLTQIPEASLDAAQAIADAVVAAGMDYTMTGDEVFTQEQYDLFYNGVVDLWKADTQGITDTVFASYAADYAEAFGWTVDDLAANEGLKTAFGMLMWGFADYDGETLTTSAGTFDMANGVYPTNDDYYAAARINYADDFASYFATESATGTTTDSLYNELMAKAAADQGVDMTAGVPNIEGIKKLDNYTVEVRLNGFSAPAVYQLTGIHIAPKHYYGDGTYDYDANNFGHPIGDLSCIVPVQDKPMGAGPYKFIKYENRVVYYEANDKYFDGAPAIKNMQYKETISAEVASAIQTGTADGGEMNGTKGNFEMLRSYNSNGEVTGDVVTTYSVANLGYGYIGINTDTVNVGGEAGSDASKNLRKALATILSVYRDTAIDSYYGDAASIINYPISTTSWACPQPADEGYQVAYSVDVNGNALYTADMTTEDRYAVALQATIDYLKAAGYTFDEATGMFTAAPEGAKLSYEIIIPGDGIGDHPSFAILTDAKNALAGIGIELKINDPSDNNILWDSLDAGTQELWAAAWQATVDPDMYQTYHSSSIVGKGGSDSNHYHIASDELDQLIVDARTSADQNYRKVVYKAALDVVLDWAVEIPVYQRQNIVIASTERVDISSVTPDVTTFWKWLSEIETMKMNTK